MPPSLSGPQAGYQPTQAVEPVLEARVSHSEIHPVAHWTSHCDKEPLSNTQTPSLRRPYTRLTRSGSSAASLFISTLVPRPSSYPTPTGGSFTSSVASSAIQSNPSFSPPPIANCAWSKTQARNTSAVQVSRPQTHVCAANVKYLLVEKLSLENSQSSDRHWSPTACVSPFLTKGTGSEEDCVYPSIKAFFRYALGLVVWLSGDQPTLLRGSATNIARHSGESVSMPWENWRSNSHFIAKPH